MKTEINEKQKNGFFNSITFKLIIIGFLSLLLLIPAGMIKNLITEREQRRDETIIEVTSKFGKEQTLCGPVLTVPFLTHSFDKDKKIISTKHLAHFLPEELDISGNILPEIRYRGIYKVIAYNSKLNFKGKFIPLDFSELNIDNPDILWNDAYFSFGITDLRGINKNLKVFCNDSLFSVNAGLKDKDVTSSGVTVNYPVLNNNPMSFSIEIDLNGSHSLNFIPLGKETNASIQSTWASPSFEGAFIPDKREVTDSGFIANWNILQLNRNYPQKWVGKDYSVFESTFGTRLFQEVDTYQKTNRSVKYAFLFIALTFILFFFSEVLNKKKIHAIYYLLVGAALTIFYSLLIALSEHISFNLSYLLASIAIISLITVFSYSIFKNKIITSTILLVLIALYSFLFTILQLADYSLLLGNIGLVIVLALVMYFSLKVDWFELKGSVNNEG